VVELGPEVRAWGTYPGGQSGNPASARYADHIGAWSRGELDTLRFPKSERDLDARIVSATLVLSPERR
jgi:penicillin G amidase